MSYDDTWDAELGYGADYRDDFEDHADRDWRYDDDWYDDDSWRDEDPYSEPWCGACHDSGYLWNDKRCRACNPPAWLVHWWTVSDTLTKPYRWLRRRLRRQPHEDEWGPF